MSKYSGEPKKEDMFTVIGVMFLAMAGMGLLVWLAARAKIVAFWAPKLYVLGRMYLWLPGDVGVPIVQGLHDAGVAFLQRPTKVDLFEWVRYWNTATRPLVILLVCALLVWLALIMLKTRPQVSRQFSKRPQQLAVHLSHVFTGTAPILHLRKAIAQNKERFWRRQVFPHELLVGEKVEGKPLISGGEVHRDRLLQYLFGLVTEKHDGKLKLKLVNGRMVSRTLGIQVVNLLTDRSKRPCFPERLSSSGKVIYALLCAHAFGGEEGKKDYAKARDQLNNSARDAAHGFANLTVAQWIFDKYKNHPMAAKLFAVHHWEYTYLFELLVQAKRQGKCGHWEFLWLKPMNRTLFYVLNTVGRYTPHTESGAAFAQYQYERRCARMDHVPVHKGPDGVWRHTIYVDKALQALQLEWERFRDGEDDDDQWWTDDQVWTRLSGLTFAPPQAPPPSLAVETAFDKSMSAQAAEAHARGKAEQEAAAAIYKADASSAGTNDLQW